jgi:hypothetical protein
VIMLFYIDHGLNPSSLVDFHPAAIFERTENLVKTISLFLLLF